jgi:hypothetical protein
VRERGLVVLESEGIIASLIEDLLGNGALASHGVDRHDRACQGKHGQKVWDRRDFVGFRVRGALTKHQALLAAPRADHVQGRFRARTIEGMTQGFAVDRDDAFASLGEPRHEGLKACAKALGIKLTEDAAERIVAWEAAGEREKFAQERLLLLREIRHIHARLAPAEERAKRNQSSMKM